MSDLTPASPFDRRRMMPDATRITGEHFLVAIRRGFPRLRVWESRHSFTGQRGSLAQEPSNGVVGAGGSIDIPARRLAGELTLKLGQQVIVENRSGANGNIGGT